MPKKLKDFRKKVRVVFEEAERLIYRVLLVMYLLTGSPVGQASNLHSSDNEEQVNTEVVTAKKEM
ncbi:MULTISPECIES: hypothetical protein [Acinetobacter]|uniref:hypothetical protein n=1 Tax=Acinetobacter TaxID=469 RepID=UPI001444966E|nr:MULTISPECIES: hypothetical protein [Acinetobacter]MDM1300028.1 hypothetical protein [Acinetobacter indicus]